MMTGVQQINESHVSLIGHQRIQTVSDRDRRFIGAILSKSKLNSLASTSNENNLDIQASDNGAV